MLNNVSLKETRKIIQIYKHSCNLEPFLIPHQLWMFPMYRKYVANIALGILHGAAIYAVMCCICD